MHINFLSPLHKELASKDCQIKRIQTLIDTECCLDKAESALKLTPLHLAVITGNYRAVELLVAAGVSQLRRDARGWTALHHATLRADECMQKLLMPHNEQTNRGWTAQEMQKRLAPSSINKFFWYKGPDEEKPRQLPVEQFQKLTGTVYVDRSFATPAYLLHEWREPKEHQADEAFDGLVNSMSTLSITDDKVYLAKTKECGFGIFARVQIAAGECFLRYSGVACKKTGGVYLFEDIDASIYGSLASRANHSFPNAFVHYIQDGEIEEPVFIATEEIKPHEEICIDYGNEYWKSSGGGPLELRYEAVAAFAQTASAAITKLQSPSNEDPILQTHLTLALHYIVKSRALQARLVTDGHLCPRIAAILK